MKNFSILMTAIVVLGGVSYAFADGVLNDAEYTRAHGGVGNYLFRGTPVETAEKADAAEPLAVEESDTTGPIAATDRDTINLGASSAGRAH